MLTHQPRRFGPLRAALVTLTLAACAARGAPPAAPAPPAPAPPPVARTGPPDLATLTPDQVIGGFTTRASYVDDDGKPRGARFVHSRTGFVFDYVTIESTPQAMIYVNTYPDGSRGEPHTQEHLLLGKGNKGRWLGNVEHATLAIENAFTANRRTVYDFSTSAGAETFWRLFGTYVDALLHPDYGDEELRREVRNFGVAKRPDGSLALEEKGTVYNEMVNTSEMPQYREWYAGQRLLYGDGHPLANDSGGTPEGIRELTPAIIRAFHAAHYRLGNMGMVGSFPSTMPLETTLSRLGEVLDSFGPGDVRPGAIVTEATLPPFRPAPVGATRVVDYPYASVDHPVPATLSWPATHELDASEWTVRSSFMEAFADGVGSTLYKALVDRSTRVLDLDAKNVAEWELRDHGAPVSIQVQDIGSAHADEASMKALREVVRAQLEAIAAWPDGSKELAAFDERVNARIDADRRRLLKRLDTPPEFGARGTGDVWVDLVEDLARAPGFRKSLTYHEALAAARAAAAPSRNAWRDRIRAWGLLEAPYAVVVRPSPAMRARLDHERDERVAAELVRLEGEYGTHDAQEALRRRAGEIDEATAAIAKEEASVPTAPLAPDLPMTSDDLLKWTKEERGGVSRVVSTIDGMKSAALGLSLRVDGVPEELLPWLGVLPALLSNVGVIRDGAPVPYDEVEDRLRREVLKVDVHFSSDTASGRTELALEASGIEPEETKRALRWVQTFLTAPDWRVANVARLRDVLENRFADYHGVMGQSEESWLQDAADDYRRQDSPLLLHTDSTLTRVHDAFFASWQLEGGEDAKGVAPFLRSLGEAGKRLDRASLAKLAGVLAEDDPKAAIDPKIAAWVRSGRALPNGARSRVRKAGRDLGQLLGDLPDASLAKDWAALCGEMAKGVSRAPDQALADLARTLAAIRHVDKARLWMVGSAANLGSLAGDVDATIASLDPSPGARTLYSTRPRVRDRARGRGASEDSSFVALVDPNRTSASLVHTAPAPGLDETSPARLAELLATNVFGGAGTQSFYKRIWGAALAYSGYTYTRPAAGREVLYADRAGNLAELLRFVDADVRGEPEDARLVDYSVVSAFSSRVAWTFEERARAMAIDLVEGRPPERVRAFRERLLELRKRPGLAAEMHADSIPAMGALIPSLSPSKKPVPGAQYFTMGPEARIAEYEKEIQRALGASVKVVRIYPRDFWDVR